MTRFPVNRRGNEAAAVFVSVSTAAIVRHFYWRYHMHTDYQLTWPSYNRRERSWFDAMIEARNEARPYSWI